MGTESNAVRYQKRKAYYQTYNQKDKEKTKAQWRALRDFLIDLKTGRPCHDCTGVFPVECMDYDHRDASTKRMCIATMLAARYSKEAILSEIEKCDLVCANCHRIRTKARMGLTVVI